MNKHEPPLKPREAAVFKSNRSQAVRIPKELAFPEGVKKVEIIRSGNGLLIVPVTTGKGWAAYFRNGPFLPDDFPDDIEDMPPPPTDPI